MPNNAYLPIASKSWLRQVCGTLSASKKKMAEDKPRLARLSAIITELQSKRIVTAKDIATKYKVSIRTVYRDIRTLEKSGVPIITEEGKGYSIMEGYKLPPIMFTEEEAMALITAEQLIKQNKDKSLSKSYENAITKIKSILKYNQKAKTELLTSRLQVRTNRTKENTSHYLIQLQSNIANFQVIDINYLSLSNHTTQRKIEPFALYTTKENWVLVAFCQDKKDFRAFRLDCIQDLKVTGNTFEPHKITLEQYLEQCRKKWKSTPDIPMSQGHTTFASNKNNNIMQKVKIEPFKLIGISIRTTNENGQSGKEITELWGKFMSENVLEKIPNKVDNTVYSLYTDYEGDHTKPYTAVLGCKVHTIEEVPENMIGKSFKGGNYIKTSAKGDLMKGLVVNKWSEIFEMKLDRAFTADFELFGEKAQNPNNAEIDFLISIN